MNVRATVERLGREHVGKSWWVDLAEALIDEFEPVVAERDRLREVAEAVASRDWGSVTGYDINKGSYRINPQGLARAALDRETP